MLTALLFLLLLYCSQAPAATGNALKVTLSNQATGKSIPQVTLIALEKTGGVRLRRASGQTNSNGVFRFTLKGLGAGATFLIKAKNPFGDGKNYVSAQVSKAGSLVFRIAPAKTGGGTSSKTGGGKASAVNNKTSTPATRAELHLLNRITFGPTAELLTQLRRQGREAFIDQQLHPERISDSGLNARLARNPASAGYKRLQMEQLIRAMHSERQLNELMTWFWDNHFNTSTRTPWEKKENAAFRAKALGRFRDLLSISASSPAMLSFLDNKVSKKADPNENYARELMELHTLGVDGGFSSRDVVEVARAFTGWGIAANRFQFNPKNHDTGKKVVLGRTIPAGGGVKDGEKVLDILATHPSTARFICRKLAQLFITDEPSQTTIKGCAGVFTRSGGDTRQLVDYLLHTPAFSASGNMHSKYRNPLEFTVALLRGMAASLGTAGGGDLYWDGSWAGLTLDDALFKNPVPTGLAETGERLISSQQYLARVQLANRIAFNKPRQGSETAIDPVAYFRARGLTRAEQIVDYLFEIATGGVTTDTERRIALNLLTDSGKTAFSLGRPDADTRLRRLVATVYSLPGAQLQ